MLPANCSGRSAPCVSITSGQSFGVTCSFGVAEWEEQDTIDLLMRRADMAMYEAKKSGRDRIVASDTFVLTHEPR